MEPNKKEQQNRIKKNIERKQRQHRGIQKKISFFSLRYNSLTPNERAYELGVRIET